MSLIWESAKHEAKPVAFGLLCSLPLWIQAVREYLNGVLQF